MDVKTALGSLLVYVKSMLVPDGIAIITTPDIQWMRARIRALISTKVPRFDEKSDPTYLMPILCISVQRILARRAMVIDSMISYPADPAVTIAYGRGARVARNLAKAFLKDEFYGDNLVRFVRHER